MKKDNKILLGIILILVAVILILQDSPFYHLIPFVGGWSILELLVSGILIYWAIKNLIRRNFMNSSLFLTIFVLFNKTNLDIQNLSNWKIIFIGLLIGIGLTLVVGGNGVNVVFNFELNDKKKVKDEKINKFSTRDNIVKIERVFVSSVDYIEPMDFEGADIEIVFSNTSIYLDKVNFIDDYAYINLSQVFSSVNLYVPKNWEIVSQISLVGAKFTEHNYDPNVEKDKQLKIGGEGVFSSIRIYYI